MITIPTWAIYCIPVTQLWCAYFAYKIGVDHERKNWNKLIDKGLISKPKLMDTLVNPKEW